MFGRKRMQRENAALREALAWYADEAHWCRHAVNPKGTPRQWIKSKAANDRGDRARRVLMTQIGALPTRFLSAVADARPYKPKVPQPITTRDPTPRSNA